ncbi:bifunctional UDP-N-acetylglucosamine diphosphorylase/glucosamine-1-phosphate N-acetyltransferase GlmU [Aristophania vespae]|uniref:bifunctional UDP-N-acetylglucosamine diphosphorylase/glucosamine-1-phosphate N-acetyltransferase GlmU n=1 Tax=Aristophania vespae TaxID=2697033 RepID=UPI0023514AFE|nr:bifunctional UDP-N-acetylglucosamine diphosphorylase/glucosamine-1-phosphate N-acetyltransferase GlmU [Aristophania vespae]UMM63241.1 Bifunctional protein GlmU [Aristophania vespae]
MTPSLTAVILAAGKGTRMRSSKPKAMQPLAHKPMVAHLIDSVARLTDKIIVVIGPDMADLEQAVAPHKVIIQTERKGTGHAALTASKAFGEGDVIILNADNPLVSSETLASLVKLRRTEKAALTVIGMNLDDPAQYGRLVQNQHGEIERIVEYKDATEQERSITLCNAGMICAPASSLRKWLKDITPHNAQNELYLTDIVGFAAKEGSVLCLQADQDELVGINSRAELARAEQLLQKKLRLRAMDNGVTLIDPSSVYFSADTIIEPDVLIEPNVFIGPGVTIKTGAHIKAFSHLEGCVVGENSLIGPYARLRPGTICEEGTHIGNFVELKNTTLGRKSKANHLTYLGDSEIGPNVNIGAGTITCNYDGYFKHKTTIGAHSFIGSNTIMVAPLKIDDNTLIAAGSVLTKDVPSGAMAFGRAQQVNIEGRGSAYKERLKAKKDQS